MHPIGTGRKIAYCFQPKVRKMIVDHLGTLAFPARSLIKRFSMNVKNVKKERDLKTYLLIYLLMQAHLTGVRCSFFELMVRFRMLKKNNNDT